jgi:hypothetical protein
MHFEPPLSWCVVECDGSGCASGNTGWHTHQPQVGETVLTGPLPAAHARVERGNVTYTSVGG